PPPRRCAPSTHRRCRTGWWGSCTRPSPFRWLYQQRPPALSFRQNPPRLRSCYPWFECLLRCQRIELLDHVPECGYCVRRAGIEATNKVVQPQFPECMQVLRLFGHAAVEGVAAAVEVWIHGDVSASRANERFRITSCLLAGGIDFRHQLG